MGRLDRETVAFFQRNEECHQ